MCATFIFIIKWYDVDGTPGRHLKKIPFPQHQQNYVNTLTWIVNIKNNETVDGDFVDKIERDMNLKFIRKFRDLDDHFVFAHVNSDNLNFTLSDDEIKHIIKEVEVGLQADPSVNWFSHQKIVSRQKRQWMPFTDPAYRQQWHLVNVMIFYSSVCSQLYLRHIKTTSSSVQAFLVFFISAMILTVLLFLDIL